MKIFKLSCNYSQHYFILRTKNINTLLQYYTIQSSLFYHSTTNKKDWQTDCRHWGSILEGRQACRQPTNGALLCPVITGQPIHFIVASPQMSDREQHHPIHWRRCVGEEKTCQPPHPAWANKTERFRSKDLRRSPRYEPHLCCRLLHFCI